MSESSRYPVEMQIGGDGNGLMDRTVDRTVRCKHRVGALSRLSLFGPDRAEGEPHLNPAEHQHPVLQLDLSRSHRAELPIPPVDPARLQRAPGGAEQSGAGRGHYVVKRGGVGIRDLAPDTVMPRDGAVGSELNRVGLRWQVGQPQWTSDPGESHLRCIYYFSHKSLELGALSQGLGAYLPDSCSRVPWKRERYWP